MGYVSFTNPLNDFQSGFRTGHSTITAAMVVKMTLLVHWTENGAVLPLFEDLSEAFDSVDHRLLLDKLRNAGLASKTVNCLCCRPNSVC